MSLPKKLKKEADKMIRTVTNDYYQLFLNENKGNKNKNNTYLLSKTELKKDILNQLKNMPNCNSVEESFLFVNYVKNSIVEHLLSSRCYNITDGRENFENILREDTNPSNDYTKDVLELISNNISDRGYIDNIRAIKKDFEIFEGEQHEFSYEDLQNGVKTIHYLESVQKNRGWFSKFKGFFTGRNKAEKNAINQLKNKLYSLDIPKQTLDNAIANPFKKENLNSLKNDFDKNINTFVHALEIGDKEVDESYELDTSSVYFDQIKVVSSEKSHFKNNIERDFKKMMTNEPNPYDQELNEKYREEQIEAEAAEFDTVSLL